MQNDAILEYKEHLKQLTKKTKGGAADAEESAADKEKETKDTKKSMSRRKASRTLKATGTPVRGRLSLREKNKSTEPRTLRGKPKIDSKDVDDFSKFFQKKMEERRKKQEEEQRKRGYFGTLKAQAGPILDAPELPQIEEKGAPTSEKEASPPSHSRNQAAGSALRVESVPDVESQVLSPVHRMGYASPAPKKGNLVDKPSHIRIRSGAYNHFK